MPGSNLTRDTTRDAFLGGKLEIEQPVGGYRAGMDPVLLAAAVQARASDTALELGCGVGVASLCLMRRIPGIEVTGIERHPRYAELAQKNAKRNECALSVVQGDLAEMPDGLRQTAFDHVLLNPPYYDRARTTRSPDAAREAALGEETPLDLWIATAARRLRPKGRMVMIQRVNRLSDAFRAVDRAGLGSIELRMIHPREGREAVLFLIRCRKAGKAMPRILPPLTLHSNPNPTGRHDDYTPEIVEILRNGSGLRWD